MTPEKIDFRENKVSSLNKSTWTLRLGLHIDAILAHYFYPFDATGLIIPSCTQPKTSVFLMSSEGIEKDRRHGVD